MVRVFWIVVDILSLLMPQKAMLNSSSSKVLEKHSLYQFFHIYLLKQQIFGGLLFGSGDVKMNDP